MDEWDLSGIDGDICARGGTGGGSLGGGGNSRDLFCLFIAFNRRFGCVLRSFRVFSSVLRMNRAKKSLSPGFPISITSMV
jgi:hypothetical protein